MEGMHSMIQKITKEDEHFPKKLRCYKGMPETLYFTGRLPEEDRPTAAIIGARACSPYGRIQAFRYAKVLSNEGVQIISGLAYGIDGEGHKGALEGKTPTFAVLGNGLDVCYPRANAALYRRIPEEGGGLISEYPPGTKPIHYHFPARNRIISALADLVLVVEAKEKSGSLITANYALEQGKMVYAIPGPVNEELSRGCHQLIFDGAGIAYCPEVLLSEWHISPESQEKKMQKENLGLEREQNLVYSCLDFRPKSIDFVARQTGLSVIEVSRILVELSLSGHISETGRNYYIRNQ